MEIDKQPIEEISFAILSSLPEELVYITNKFKELYTQIEIDGVKFSIFDYKNNKILVSAVGIGTTFAASMLTLIHATFHPKIVIYCGVAGGIDPNLKICDVVIAEKAFEAEIQNIFQTIKNTPFETSLINPAKNLAFPASYLANQDLLTAIKEIIYPPDVKICTGTVVTSNSFPAPKELFPNIKECNAIAIDMETSALYQVAWILNIPIIAIRGISNMLSRDGTDENIDKSDLAGSAEAAGKITLITIDALIKKYGIQNQSGVYEREINDLIKQYNLQPHVEGGFYNRNFTSTIYVNSLDEKHYDGEARKAGSSIYYLLRQNEFSAFHVLKSDEIWHYYKGSLVKIHMIDEEGNLTTHLLGDFSQHPDAKFQIIIPAGYWFAAEVVDKKSYCFIGCTVSPGFEFKDFCLADRKSLTAQFPALTEIIKKFTFCSEKVNL